jgi:hypothetical protein
MNDFISFKEFLTTSGTQIPIFSFLINLIATAILSYFTGRLYVKYGNSLSSREIFSRNFILIGMTTMMIITVVKSSLALSLGLVGALSIIRFRAAIKEPEELAYLFLLISIGLGFGADQGKITIVAFLTISTLLILLKKFSYQTIDNENLLLTVSLKKSIDVGFEKIIKIVREQCSAVSLKRFDEGKDTLIAVFSVNLENIEELEGVRISLLDLSESIEISFLDNKNIF